MDKVSVIVPAYNSEDTIRRCLDSILKQTYKNIEIIVINDGSTDSTEAICREYAAECDKVYLYNQKNQGVSAARNSGIDKATGRYLQFVDADDYIEENMTERLVSEFKGPGNWVICGCLSDNGDTSAVIRTSAPETMDRLETMRALVAPDSIRGYLVNKLFENDILKKYQLHMRTDIFVCEDLIFCLEYAAHIKSATYIEEPLYHYIYRDDSVTHKKYSPKRFSSLQAFEEIKKITEKYHDEKLNKNVEAHYLVLVIQLFVMLKRNHHPIRSGEMKTVLNNMKQRRLCLWITNWDMKYKLTCIPIKILSLFC